MQKLDIIKVTLHLCYIIPHRSNKKQNKVTWGYTYELLKKPREMLGPEILHCKRCCRVLWMTALSRWTQSQLLRRDCNCNHISKVLLEIQVQNTSLFIGVASRQCVSTDIKQRTSQVRLPEDHKEAWKDGLVSITGYLAVVPAQIARTTHNLRFVTFFFNLLHTLFTLCCVFFIYFTKPFTFTLPVFQPILTAPRPDINWSPTTAYVCM